VTSRRRYLITYDIGDDRRRGKVFDVCHQEGDHTQYSVFVADLSARELVALQAAIEPVINHDEDQVLIADLGPTESGAGRVIASIGRPYEPPVRALVV